MKATREILENGIVIGNTYNKYGSHNLIVKKLMQGYEKSLQKLIHKIQPVSIHEVGCGEGYWTLKWIEEGIDARGSDFSKIIIKIARKNAAKRKLPENRFFVRNIYDLIHENDTADLVICAEVLEHVEEPEKALEALKKVANPYLIVCVPHEPIWSMLNMARGKYWKDWGNTPGHIQKWSKSGFINLVNKHFDIIDIKNPLPWTMLLCMNNR